MTCLYLQVGEDVQQEGDVDLQSHLEPASVNVTDRSLVRIPNAHREEQLHTDTTVIQATS